MSGRNNELWIQHFKVYKDYVNKYHRLPPTHSSFEYKGLKLGLWVANQVSAHRIGNLPEDRLKMLNDFNPVWNGTREEKEQENKRLLFSSDWRNKVLNGHTPIDVYYSEEDLYVCLSEGIVDLEGLLQLDTEDYIFKRVFLFYGV